MKCFSRKEETATKLIHDGTIGSKETIRGNATGMKSWFVGHFFLK